jgi:hypothetical protein
MFICFTKRTSAINSIYSGQLLFSSTTVLSLPLSQCSLVKINLQRLLCIGKVCWQKHHHSYLPWLPWAALHKKDHFYLWRVAKACQKGKNISSIADKLASNFRICKFNLTEPVFPLVIHSSGRWTATARQPRPAAATIGRTTSTPSARLPITPASAAGGSSDRGRRELLAVASLPMENGRGR